MRVVVSVGLLWVLWRRFPHVEVGDLVPTWTPFNVVLLVTAVLTAFYMARAVLMTFFGDYRGHGEPHEAPRSMTGVLAALATATVFVGLLGSPQLGAVPTGTSSAQRAPAYAGPARNSWNSAMLHGENSASSAPGQFPQPTAAMMKPCCGQPSWLPSSWFMPSV